MRILLASATISFIIAITGKSSFPIQLLFCCHQSCLNFTCRIISKNDTFLNELLNLTHFLCTIGDGEEGLTAYVEPFVILLILVLNAIVAIWQDSNADSALEALKEMQAAESLVLRNSEWVSVEAKTLVPGDIVKVTQGQCVPADLRCVDILSIALQLEQAALTGESVSVQKNTVELGENAKMLQDQKNMLF